MEVEGHPTQDLIDELEARGALRVEGASTGPRVDSLRFAVERAGEQPGFWLFLPRDTFRTGLDEFPE
jgi:hypothetical protein